MTIIEPSIQQQSTITTTIIKSLFTITTTTTSYNSYYYRTLSMYFARVYLSLAAVPLPHLSAISHIFSHTPSFLSFYVHLSRPPRSYMYNVCVCLSVCPTVRKKKKIFLAAFAEISSGNMAE